MLQASRLVSKRLEGVRPSATVAMSTRARELRRAGRDSIALSAGQPDFPTPVHVCEAAAEAMARGETCYTNLTGTPELKAAISASFRRTSGLDFGENEIIVSPGGKSVIAAALAATLSPGDEVVVPTPCWTSYPDMVRLFGGTPVPVAGGADFKLTPEALDAFITPETRWLILNSPGNPTGAVYSASELSALAEVLRRHPHVWVLSDDIYSTVTFATPFATLAAVAPDLASRTLIVSGVSKSYSMTGWRVGWGAGPAELITLMATVQGQTTTCAPSISQAASVAALEGPQSYLADWTDSYRARRDLVVRGLNALPGITCPVPDGAFYAFFKLPEGTDDMDWCTRLLEERGVALVPGAAFSAPGHVRLSYAASEADLRSALQRMERA